MIFAGIEGGATCSKIVLLKVHDDSKVEKLAEVAGDSLNCLLRGVEYTCEYVAKLIKDAVNLQPKMNLPIDAVCMGLSGAENPDVAKRLHETWYEFYRSVAKKCFVENDASASIATAFKNGGVVIIAGTGSTLRYLNKNMELFACGGHGHLVGDGGSGFWIAIQGIIKIFDDDDGLEPCPYSTNFLKDLFLKHFKLNDIKNILSLLYGPTFVKADIASVTVKIAENKDPLCKHLFELAGDILGKHLVAVAKNIDQETLEDVPVLQIGSVFKSWSLLKPGFENVLKKHETGIKKVSFYQLTESAALGAALMAAKKMNIEVDYDFAKTKFVDSIVL